MSTEKQTSSPFGLLADPCGLPVLPYDWPGMMPSKGLTAIVGEADHEEDWGFCCAHNWLCGAIASSVTNGSSWPDGSGPARRGGVIVYIPGWLRYYIVTPDVDPRARLRDLFTVEAVDFDLVRTFEQESPEDWEGEGDPPLSNESVRAFDTVISGAPFETRLVLVPFAGLHFSPGDYASLETRILHLRRLRAWGLDRGIPVLVVVDIPRLDPTPDMPVAKLLENARSSYLPDCVDSIIVAGPRGS